MDFEFTPVDAIDKVPEQFRSLYGTEPGEEGKFNVADSFKPVAEALSGFNRSNKQLRNDLKTKVVDLTPLTEYGDNPATIAEAIRAKIEEASASKNQDVTKQIEGAKAGLTAAHAKELEKRDARNTALQTQLYGLLVENEATSAVAELKGVPDLLMPFIKNQVKVVEADGRLTVSVMDASGEVRYGATGSPMTIKELVSEMKANEKYGRLFESEAPAGGGFRPGSGQQRPAPRTQAKTANEKIASGLSAMSRRR